MRGKRVVSIVGLLGLAGAVAAWMGFRSFFGPLRHPVGALPADLPGRAVSFRSGSGTLLRGWLVPGRRGGGAVVLMHGVRADRRSLLGRARFLARNGYSVLLFDFRAHGESTGERITFGYRESEDARAAVRFARAALPGERVGVVGVSLGGAAAILASPPLEVDALVLEMVYPTIDDALADRLQMGLGEPGRRLAPSLLPPMGRVLGVRADRLRPIDRVAEIDAPKLFVAGSRDRHTTLAESKRLFGAARGPKRLWVVEGAIHEDLHAHSTAEYEHRVGAFFAEHLRRKNARHVL